ncbi:hypothetical protein SuNHUV7_05410 (plasmid) [Pseudoseohaeicola sp. NH-UV-7]
MTVLSRKAVINAECGERLVLPKAAIQSQCEKNQIQTLPTTI